MRILIVALAGALSLGAAASAEAVTITSSLSDWQANAGGSYAVTTQFGILDNTGTNSVNLADGQTLGITDGATVYTTPNATEPCCLTGYSGQVVEVGYNNEVFTFSPSISALGFIVEPNATVATKITVTLSDGTTAPISADFTKAGSTQFIGFYGAAGSGIDSISVAFNDTVDINAFDLANVVDTVVPEPMSVAVLLTGMTGLGMARRRRRA